jgi:hypothetical protein
MPNGTYVIIALLVLAVLVAVILPMAQRKDSEGFLGFHGLPSKPDEFMQRRAIYTERGQQMYNKFADPMDPRRPDFARTNNPASRAAVNAEIQAATSTAMLSASGDIKGSGLTIVPEGTTFQLPPDNKISHEAKKCEALRGRDACAKLNTAAYANCGVCLKEGTPYSFDGADDKFIGGLLVLPEDRKEAVTAAGGDPSKAQYRATVGSCPAGYLTVNRAMCQKLTNQLDCMEVGQTGGFNGGKTIEGKDVGLQKCAFVPNAGEDAYVYLAPETPENVFTRNRRRFNVGLRVLAPRGTGLTRVLVIDRSGKQRGFGVGNSQTGFEFVVPVTNVREGEELNVIVGLDAPYRPSGKPEVFQVVNNDRSTKWPDYNQSQASAKNVCERLGAAHASKQQLEDAWRNGMQQCSAGWTSSGFNGYPMYQSGPGCGAGNRMNEWMSSNPKKMGHSWCYGIKPPQSWNTLSMNYIRPFYEVHKQGSEPKGVDKWSEHGTSYQAPYYRGILLQWEMNKPGTRSVRTIPFEPTILRVDDANPSNISTNGAKTFRTLRRYGTFAGSSIMRDPKPTNSSAMMTDSYWIWSANALKQSVKFTCAVPGTFMDTTYSDEPAKMNFGPLITNPKTLELLRRSPCVGQEAGKYSVECLTNLFVGSGGDPVYGRLVMDDGGLSKFNKPVDGKLMNMDEISNYFSGLYSIATSGRDLNGDPVADMDTINDAAQKMLGVSLITPCDNIVVDGEGNVSLTPKTPPLDAPCLNHLYLNAGSEKGRTLFDRLNKKSIGPTYTSLMDRYSGLKKTEGNKQSRKQHPFQACQRTGTMAPVSADGKINEDAVLTANRFSTIGEIQDLYDGVHNYANYKGGSSNADEMKLHEAAVKACYGIERASGSAGGRKGCGTKAQFVTILGKSKAYGGSADAVMPLDGNVAVLDGSNRNVSQGKKITRHGKNWIVDLGAPTEVNKVIFVPTPGQNNVTQVGSPLQLLDSNGKIITQKLIGQFNFPKHWGQPESFIFTANDTMPRLKITDILDGSTPFSLESAISARGVLTHTGGNTYPVITVPDSTGQMNQAFRDNATWRIRPGANKDASWLSIVAATMNLYGEWYLRDLNGLSYLNWPEVQNPSWVAQVSLRIIPAVNGDPSMVSIVSSQGRYMCNMENDWTKVGFSSNIKKDDAYDINRYCWRIVPGLGA